MARYRRNPLTPQAAVDLAPIQVSAEDAALEAELKLIFKRSYDSFIKPAERTTNTAGTPHIGPFDQVERAVKAEGLALQRRGGEEAMRYLFRAWRARNPKRGLHMLRAYLQLLWPGGWTATQMWQDKAQAYPTVAPADGGNHYLTSRVNVEISSSSTDGSDVLAAAPALRSVLAARFLLNVSVKQETRVFASVASAMYGGAIVHTFNGEFSRDPEKLGIASGMYAGAKVQSFEGVFDRM